MALSHPLKKILTLACTLGLGLSVAPLVPAPSTAATVTKTISSSCRTNGAPLDYNVTSPKNDSITVTTPNTVQAGEEYTVRVDYQPERAPGKASIATITELKDVVIRYTIDDPNIFVTARLVGNGENISGSPEIALVGDDRLIVSGVRVNVDGKDTNWAPPALEIVMRADKSGSAPTIHPAVEGPAGQFNNPENFFTAKTVTETRFGNMAVQMNCQALSSSNTLAAVPIEGTAPKTSAHDRTTSRRRTGKTSRKPSTTKNSTGRDSSEVTDNTNQLKVLDEDIYTDPDFEPVTMPLWANILIGLIIVGVAGLIGYWLYRRKKK